MSSSKPQVKAMLVCDNIITEKETGKNSLIGIFENISAKQFPCVHGSLSVYVNFTEALGKYNFKLELINVENNTPIYPGSEIPGVESSDISAYYNLIFVLKMLKFDQPGKYEFRLFINGEIGETKTIDVKSA